MKFLRGILYGVGVGPGDKKLLTILAAETLENADVIAVPDTGGERIALKVVEEYIRGKELMYCSMPMTKDAALLKQCHKKCAESISYWAGKRFEYSIHYIRRSYSLSTYMYISG